GDGTFMDAAESYSPIRSTPLVADLNGDGISDVAVLAGDGSIFVRLGHANQPGTFQPPLLLAPGPGQRPIDLAAVTINGTVELAALDAGGNTITFDAYQPGSGFRATSGPAIPGGIPVRLIAGDVDGDGREDLVAAASGGSG